VWSATAWTPDLDATMAAVGRRRPARDHDGVLGETLVIYVQQ
jgi:hypothetical protein